MLSKYLKLDEFTFRDIDQIGNYPKAKTRQPWENLSKELKEYYIKKAEEKTGFRYPTLLATDYMKFTTEGTRWPYTTPQTERWYILSDFVIAECIEHKGRFMADIINGIYAISEETTWVSNAHNFVDDEHNNAQEHNKVLPLPSKKKRFIDLWAATTSNVLAWTYYLLKDELDEVSPIICENIEITMEERFFGPYENNPKMWWRTIDNNWNINISSQVLENAVILIRDEKRRKKFFEEVIKSYNIFLNAYHDDGACEEGPHYCISDLQIMKSLDFLRYISDGQIDCFKFDKLRKMAIFELNMYAGNNKFIPFADCKLSRHTTGNFMHMLGRRFENEDLKILGAHLGGGPSDEETVPASLLRLFPPKNLNEDIKKYASKEPHFDKCVYYDSTNTMFLREKDTTGGLVMAVKGGHNDEHHNHLDVGNFVVFSDTNPVITDMGIGDYTKKAFSPERYDVWVMNSKYHNVPYIGSIEQKAGKEFKAKDVEHGKDYISMDISDAYGSDKIKKFVRTIEYDRASNTFNFSENYEFSEAMDIDLHFMLCSKPEIKDGKVLLDSGIVIEYGLDIKADFEELVEETKEYPIAKWTKEYAKIYRLKLKSYGKCGEIKYSIKKEK